MQRQKERRIFGLLKFFYTFFELVVYFLKDKHDRKAKQRNKEDIFGLIIIKGWNSFACKSKGLDFGKIRLGKELYKHNRHSQPLAMRKDMGCRLCGNCYQKQLLLLEKKLNLKQGCYNQVQAKKMVTKFIVSKF